VVALERFRSASLGRGYVEKFSGSRGVRDTERNVDIDVVLAGDFPGDGREKPVPFPDPAVSAVRGAAFKRLHPYVRERFADLWQAAQTRDSQSSLARESARLQVD
jgi:hypothetical protein